MVILTALSSRVLLARYYAQYPVGAWTLAVLVSRQALTVVCGIAIFLAAIVGILQ